jgi:hypothetical protein
MKYLIFNASTEYESFVAIVEWSPEYITLLRKRMAAATKLRQELDGLAWMEFYDYVDLYERTTEIDEWIEANAEAETWEGRMWVMTDKTPEFDDTSRVRVDASYASVDENSCYWKVRPKHSDIECETQMVRADDEAFAE